MAKKSKKQTRKVSSAPAVTVQQPLQPETKAAPATAAGRTYTADFNPDYSQTIKDLRRIGILAGSFFAILAILSFFLR